MNIQQALLPKSSSNGFARRRGDREGGARLESKVQSGKSNQGRIQATGSLSGGKTGGYESSSRDRLVYMTTCLIGHMVEVHVKNGSIYSGIFHATDAEKDFGIVLKMARLVKDGTLQGNKAVTEFISKAPTKILIIPAKELVQVIAKDVAVTSDGFASELQHEKQQELLIDSVISQSRHVGLERELEPWVPDEDYPQCPDLENIFSGSWNRNWDQFETNQKLFGVKSTFNEELYTTKLERGPQTRELEKEAMRIAREIEGEETRDLHLAEERGLDLHDNFDIDEEMRYSSVYRGRGFDDSGYEEEEDILLDSQNIETFGDSSDSLSRGPVDLTSLQRNEGVRMSSSTSFVDEAPSSKAAIGADLNHTDFNDQAKQLASEIPSESFSVSDSESRIQDNLLGEHGGSKDAKECTEKLSPSEDPQLSNSIDSQSLLNDKLDGSDKTVPSVNSTTHAQSSSLSKVSEKPSASGDLAEGPASSKVTGETPSVNTRGQPGSSKPSNSDCIAVSSASSGPGLSPCSSMGSLSSEKSTLNPHAKEFKLNPNAKSFTPSQTSVRPPSPVSDGSFYYQTPVSPVPHMHMPVNFGIGPSFPGHQPVVFNPQVAPMQSPQAYFHPTGPQYGQPMLLGQRQVMYYQPDMQYKGRDY
ncbi:polyadenylate-binding protein-interacting protein 3-like isoform X1 [Gossypium australe]|uniref:Polyadenylate-binding protein-interacting protein 3-like isoform X1 n=1 Tax=Gossypium australe TaxID=47621 RepID=A0A5B6W9K3_9ROSI|nr:polyadenylate-binding protein-interacting protein 3-like isoform X1 [Gossypium australe]